MIQANKQMSSRTHARTFVCLFLFAAVRPLSRRFLPSLLSCRLCRFVCGGNRIVVGPGMSPALGRVPGFSVKLYGMAPEEASGGAVVMLPNAPDGSVRGSDGSVRGPAVPGAGDCRARKGPGWLRERPSHHSAPSTSDSARCHCTACRRCGSVHICM